MMTKVYDILMHKPSGESWRLTLNATDENAARTRAAEIHPDWPIDAVTEQPDWFIPRKKETE